VSVAFTVCLDGDNPGRSIVGGKFANLMQLTQMGITVPPAFVVTTTAFEAEAGRICEEIEDLLGPSYSHSAIPSTMHQHFIIDLRHAIAELSVSRDLRRVVCQKYDSLKLVATTTAVAIRSSATTEDETTASYAGMHDSHLGVVGHDRIIDGITECWSSLYTERALNYRSNLVQLGTAPKMAVIVQAMVAARAAGVFTSCNPVTGDPGEVVVESIFGLGEPIVSGEVTPDLFILDRGSRLVRMERIAIKESQVVLGDPPSLKSLRLTSECARMPSLGRPQFDQILRIIESIERVYQEPIESEFAVNGSGIVEILQVRPIVKNQKRAQPVPPP
jgi:pyruvate,water dikinase